LAGRRSRCTSAALAAGTILATACIGTSWSRGTWVKAGVGSSEQHRDEYDCEREAVTTAQGTARAAVWERCMRARGYDRMR
jgi:hypothetical protein